jgi:hypothetical protein
MDLREQNVFLDILRKNVHVPMEKITEAIRIQRQRNGGGSEIEISIGDVLVELKVISPVQHQAVLKAFDYQEKRRLDKLFGKKAVSVGWCTEAQMNEALTFQKQLFKAMKEVRRIEDILVEDNVIDRAQARKVWELYRTYRTRRVANPLPSLGGDVGDDPAEGGLPDKPEYKKPAAATASAGARDLAGNDDNDGTNPTMRVDLGDFSATSPTMRANDITLPSFDPLPPSKQPAPLPPPVAGVPVKPANSMRTEDITLSDPAEITFNVSEPDDDDDTMNFLKFDINSK